MHLLRHAGLEEPVPYLIRGHPVLDVLARFGLTPPPLGRPAGVYPDENRGRNDDLFGYRWFMDRH